MSDLKEYIVTLKNRDDLDAFYEDMETPGGDLYIPDRKVECANRREISRNTHYMLSDTEAEELKKDSRVSAVELTPEQRGIVVRPSYTQTGNFNKSGALNSSYRNWGLLRCVEGEQRTDWGTGGTTGQNATISVTTQGKNVDVVIVDGHFNPAHPEYAVNSDGTGGSRVVQYNWFQHNLGGGTGNYVYTPYTGTAAEDDNNHGAHVAGTAVGNTQGWARSANIYNINPYSTNPNGDITTVLFDYVRAFHNSKPVNLTTGRRNPTITNNSWGYLNAVVASNITTVVYRGATINGPFTSEQLATYGLFTFNISGTNYIFVEARVFSIEADIEDAIDDGIIVVGAAGNSSMTLGVPYDADWDNEIRTAARGYYTSDLGTPGGAVKTGPGGGTSWLPLTICVGSIDNDTTDRKSDFSNRGARIDIWAPGSGIHSSVNSGGILDSRGGGRLDVYGGTSMASPQVCGVLACALEMYPSMNNDQARAYLIKYAKSQVAEPSVDLNNKFSLRSSPNRFLAHRQERPLSGNVYPKTDYFLRPTSGQVYPRTRIKR
jgi:hypothetical protein